MATWIDFKELRSKLRFSSLLDHYKVQLRVKGDRATGFCPLPGHRGKGDGKRHSPSFSCNLRKGIFQCFSCGAKGNVLDFGCFMAGMNPNDASQLREGALKLQEIFGLGSPEVETTPAKAKEVHSTDDGAQNTSAVTESNAKPALPVVVNAPLEFELKHLDPNHPYLKSRGYTAETIKHFGLGYCSKGMMAGRIAIPLHDAAGMLIGYAGRLVEDAIVTPENPKYRFPGDRQRNGVVHEFKKSQFLYNCHRIMAPVADLIVVEGFASMWWLWQHGYTNAAALMGSSCSTVQGQLIVNLVATDGHIWIFPDGDEAGERFAVTVFAKVSQRFVRRIDPGHGRQPTDYEASELSALFPNPFFESEGGDS